jgi:hypothetical protein
MLAELAYHVFTTVQPRFYHVFFEHGFIRMLISSVFGQNGYHVFTTNPRGKIVVKKMACLQKRGKG